MTSRSNIALERLASEQSLLDNLVLMALQLVDVPIGRHEATAQKIRLGTREINRERTEELS